MSKLNESLSSAPGSIGFPILQDYQYAQRGLPLHLRSGVYAISIRDRLDKPGQIGHYVEDSETRGDMSGFLYWDRDGDARAIGTHREVFPAMRLSSSGAGGDAPTTPGSTPSPPATTPSGPRGEITPSSRTPRGPEDSIPVEPPAQPVQPQAGVTGGDGDGMVPEPPIRGGTASPPSRGIRPVRDELWLPDERYEEKAATSPRSAGSAAFPTYPGGHVGLVVHAMNEDRPIPYYHPTDPRLVAPGHGGPTSHGTFVCDLTPSGDFDPERQARLQTAFRVAKMPTGKLSLEGNTGNSLALNIGRTGNDDLIGGLLADKGGHRTWFGALSVRDGGPIDVTKGCKHRIGSTADNEPISPVHLSTLAFWMSRAGQQQHDGPLDFEEDYPQPPDYLYPVKVHLGWNALPTYQWPRDGGKLLDRGIWSWWTTFPIGAGGGDTGIPAETPGDNTPPDIPPPTTPGDPPFTPTTPSTGNPGTPSTGGGPGGGPPPTDPGNGPGGTSTPKGGGRAETIRAVVDPARSADGPGALPLWPTTQRPGNSQSAVSRDAAYTHLETSFPSVSFRPQLLGLDREDVTTQIAPPADAIREYLAESPVVLRLVAFGQQTQGANGGTVYTETPAANASGSDGPFNYTQPPGASRSRGGTAPGIVAFLPPEIDATDVDADFEPDNVTLSTSYVGVAPGVGLAFGIPDPFSGSVRDGVSMQIDAAELIVSTHNAAATKTEFLKLSAALITLADGVAISTGTTTGTEIGKLPTEKLGFHGATPTAQDTGYAVTNLTPTKTFDADTVTLAELADVVGTILNALVAKGIIGG